MLVGTGSVSGEFLLDYHRGFLPDSSLIPLSHIACLVPKE